MRMTAASVGTRRLFPLPKNAAAGTTPRCVGDPDDAGVASSMSSKRACPRWRQQFQHGPIPEPELCQASGALSSLDDPGPASARQQEGGSLGGVDEAAGLEAAPCSTHHARKLRRRKPRERVRVGVAAFAQPGDEQRDVFVVEAAEGVSSSSREVPERVQILPVGGDGVLRGEPPFGYESPSSQGKPVWREKPAGDGRCPFLSEREMAGSSRGRSCSQNTPEHGGIANRF